MFWVGAGEQATAKAQKQKQILRFAKDDNFAGGLVPVGLKRPGPVGDFFFVYAVFVGVGDAFDDLSFEGFFDVGAYFLEAGDAVDYVDGEVEAVYLV